MATTCAACGGAMLTERSDLERKHEGQTYQVAKFRCDDCDKVGFRAWETFESSRYKSTSDGYQWGAIEDNGPYDTQPPWLISGYAIVLEYDDGDTEEFEVYDRKEDAERARDRLAPTVEGHGVALMVKAI